jgi:hypothetical protein
MDGEGVGIGIVRHLGKRLLLAKFEEMVREQSLILCRDEERAIATPSELLPEDAAGRAVAVKLIQRVCSAAG